MSGSLTHAPNKVLRSVLIDLGAGTLPSAASTWPIGLGQSSDKPDNAIVIFNTTGKNEGRRQNDGQMQERYGVQILVRSGSEAVGYAKANEIAVLLDESTENVSNITIDSSNYTIYGVDRTGTINPLGKNEPVSNRNHFTINATIALRQFA